MKLRSSGVGCYQACPKKYDIKYNLGYEPVDDNHVLVFGTAMHAAFECLAKGQAVTHARQEFNKAGRILSETSRVIGELLIIMYAKKYESDGITYKHIEHKFSVEMIEERYPDLPGNTFSGAFDGIVIDSTGEMGIMEHKTTRTDITDGSKYWESKDMDTQIDLYTWAAKEMGLPIRYILYDVVKVPKMRLLKATPKEKQKFYKSDRKDKWSAGDARPGTRLRGEGMAEFRTRVQEYLIDNAPSMLVRKKFMVEDRLDPEEDLRAIYKLIGTGVFPKNKNNCYSYNRECEYRPVCMEETSLTNTGLYQLNENPLDY